MSIVKLCADHLRHTHRALTGSKLGSGHAHEIVAAFFGYPTASALQAEPAYDPDDIIAAEVLIPDLAMLDQRLGALNGLPADLPDGDDIATMLCSYLEEAQQFAGEVWHTRDLADFIQSDVIAKDPMLIENDLSSEISSTNAFFDELYVDECSFEIFDDAIVASLSGNLNGESDQDKAFVGDSIAFTTVMTMDRVAARVGYAKPTFETEGAVDFSRYYNDDEA